MTLRAAKGKDRLIRCCVLSVVPVMQSMSSLRAGYSAVVFGASGGIGSAVSDAIESDPGCGRIFRLSRREDASFDICDETSIAAVAERICKKVDSIDLIFNASGALMINEASPEKTIRRLDPDLMARQFRLNAIGPALLIKHFADALPKDRRGLFGTLSARVGSIGDNRLGGWISYRAAKAAQNQIVKTASIELSRSRPHAVLVALHPGTVATPLSDPFASRRERLAPEQSASMLLGVMNSLTPENTGGFFAYDGSPVDW